jgi:YD repeat-containing protein
MKTKSQIWLLLAFVMLATACKKSGSADSVTPTVKKYVTQMVVVSNVPGIGKVTTTTDYTYDTKKRKLTEKTGNISYNYTYYDNDKLFSSTQSFGDGNMLRYVSENTYTGSLLTRLTRIVYKNNEDVDHQITDYIYDGSNKLTEEHYPGGAVKLYTYDSNNDAVKVEDRRLDGTVNTITTYDANHRQITVTQTTALPNIPNTSSTFTYDSHDNVTKSIIITGTTTTKTATVNFTNTYDADGYLTSSVGDDGSSKTNTYSTL